ncbi:transcriptional regulator [Helicobacter aurati]|uniref:Transcriptional regulator n=1 Tax=Helicobacter aurati TaxID=137778 RepID=A0A3D8IXY4_9HELI|nr:GyrI-like domain-containing protein [Helicobacter aurati]RDU69830.1 transcriptional regulator [Helicobacter aurati]
MQKFDFKKVFKDLYAPKQTPARIFVPKMSFISIYGKGNPNDREYQEALKILYALSYAIKMDKGKNIQGYFDYVVPPLESLWWNEGDIKIKDNFIWQAMIAQPDFVTKDIFEWACNEVLRKKNLDCERASFIAFEEGLCVQMLHVGSYDNEPKSIEQIEDFIIQASLHNDIGTKKDGLIRAHHEIYLSNPNNTIPEKLKTIIRIPVRELSEKL